MSKNIKYKDQHTLSSISFSVIANPRFPDRLPSDSRILSFTITPDPLFGRLMPKAWYPFPPPSDDMRWDLDTGTRDAREWLGPDPDPAVKMACTTAGASLAGGGWIGKAAKWGLGTGRLSDERLQYRVSQYKRSNVNEYGYLPRSLTTGLFSTFFVRTAKLQESNH